MFDTSTKRMATLKQASGNTDLFFGGLPPISSFSDVEEAISAVGEEVLRHQFRAECGFGVIRFSKAEAARKACELLDQVLTTQM